MLKHEEPGEAEEWMEEISLYGEFLLYRSGSVAITEWVEGCFEEMTVAFIAPKNNSLHSTEP